MSLPDQPAAYNDCYDLFARAANETYGARLPFPTRNAAVFFQHRMQQARAIQRRANSRIYAPDHPLYNTSEFDHLQVVVRQGEDEYWVYVKPHGIRLDAVEPLTEEDLDV